MTLHNGLTALLASLVLTLAQTALAQEHHQHGNSAGDSKAQIDHMHHQLEADQAPWKEKEAVALRELNEMTIQDNADMDAIYGKIDELMAARNMIMRLRYAHLVDMRKLLTEEQKVKYDANVLKRSEAR